MKPPKVHFCYYCSFCSVLVCEHKLLKDYGGYIPLDVILLIDDCCLDCSKLLDGLSSCEFNTYDSDMEQFRSILRFIAKLELRRKDLGLFKCNVLWSKLVHNFEELSKKEVVTILKDALLNNHTILRQNYSFEYTIKQKVTNYIIGVALNN
jgi:hypothetical protein